MNMNKVKIAVAVVAMACASLCGCRGNYVDVEMTDTIVNKSHESKINIAMYLTIKIPIINNYYYFTLEHHGLKQVTKDVYDSHVIGDTYTWVESVLRESVPIDGKTR